MKVDVIGDIHGCREELLELIEKLGYREEGGLFRHPEGRQLAFVGDAADRGPDSIGVLRLLFSMQDAGMLSYSPGNHCNKLYRFFKGNNVQITHGLETTIAEWRGLPETEQEAFRKRYKRFYEALPVYQTFEDRLIVAHAGIRENMIGQPLSKKIISFVLYGDVTGDFLPDGRPVRRDWAKHYSGERWIVYGHTPVEQPYFRNRTVNIDTGCVFGGALSAFRYPEEEILSVPSRQPFEPDRFHRYHP
ncbi:bis(5'-nucleosyl)-tetraphosphatase PrpE [Indiicoccus explosivorum]|uniref:bis(5'-nucleosyl)-tetraphosphatase PrpE n=1 Tax=Indiicoccus explosivorum TaxID=1917864 RepID=UPI000B44DDB6|nr:bis(5'-nucleosyl)-tetraphosphatase PrpE [Indiicoccus explosivorum]